MSNWPWIDLSNECKNSSWDSNTNTSFLFSNPNVIIIDILLEKIQNMTLVFTLLFGGSALFYLLHKFYLQKRSNIREKNSTSFALFFGFLLCTITLGFVLIVAELLSWNSRPTNLDIINIKHSSIFVTVAVFALIELVFVFSDTIKHTERKLLYTILSIPLIYLFYFALLWIIASLFATLLFALAYPVYVITLIVLHIAYVFVVSIFFAVIALEGTSSIIIILFCILSYLSFGLFYVAIIWGYASTIVQRIVPAEGVVQGLLFLPSLILFIAGWLLKRRFFVTGIFIV